MDSKLDVIHKYMGDSERHLNRIMSIRLLIALKHRIILDYHDQLYEHNDYLQSLHFIITTAIIITIMSTIITTPTTTSALSSSTTSTSFSSSPD